VAVTVCACVRCVHVWWLGVRGRARERVRERAREHARGTTHAAVVLGRGRRRTWAELVAGGGGAGRGWGPVHRLREGGGAGVGVRAYMGADTAAMLRIKAMPSWMTPKTLGQLSQYPRQHGVAGEEEGGGM